jgi:peptidoglycan L-alanyl-D-glutamate endopeptidase CwlK
MNNFGERSLRKLEGVHPDLVRVAKTALAKSSVDFGITEGVRSLEKHGITEGVRSLEKQKILYNTGASKTMKSRHLTGHAVDVIAYVNGYTYEPFSLYVNIAEAFRLSAIEHDVEILWGAAWLKALNYYDSAELAKSTYVKARWDQGKRPFIDGPHFQLTWKDYPQ